MSNDIFEPNDSRTSNGIVFNFSKTLMPCGFLILNLYFLKKENNPLFS